MSINLNDLGLYEDDFDDIESPELSDDLPQAPAIAYQIKRLFAELNSLKKERQSTLSALAMQESAILDEARELKDKLEKAKQDDARKFPNKVVNSAESRILGITDQLHNDWDALGKTLREIGEIGLLVTIVKRHEELERAAYEEKLKLEDAASGLFSGKQGATGMFSINQLEKLVVDDAASLMRWLLAALEEATTPAQRKKIDAVFASIKWPAAVKDYIEANRNKIDAPTPQVHLERGNSVVFYSAKSSRVRFHKGLPMLLSPTIPEIALNTPDEEE